MDIIKTGKFIAEKRKEKGLRQQDLADKLHITDKAVSKWERGLACPDVSLLVPLAEVLDIGVIELLKGEKIEELDVKTADEVVAGSVGEYTHEVQKHSRRKIISLFIIATIIITLLFTINQYHVDKEYVWQLRQHNYYLDIGATELYTTIAENRTSADFLTIDEYICSNYHIGYVQSILDELYVFLKSNSSLQKSVSTVKADINELFSFLDKLQCRENKYYLSASEQMILINIIDSFYNGYHQLEYSLDTRMHSSISEKIDNFFC